MMMTPTLRKCALTTHVTSSVGWLGAIAGFLALAIAGVTAEDPQLVRAAYLSMHVITWFVIVPLSLAGFRVVLAFWHEEHHMFRTALLTIVLSLAVGPNLNLLCRTPF